MTKKIVSLLLSLIMTVGVLSGISTVSAATGGAVTRVSNYSSGIKVRWSKASDKTGYYIYRKSGSSNTWSRVKTIKSVSTVSWTDTNVTNGRKYVYKVYPYKGTKKYTNTATRTIYRLIRPGIKSLSSPSTGQMRVVSYKNSAATGYQIKYSRYSNFSNAKKITVSGTSIAKTISSLSKGKMYYVKIRSYKKVGGNTYYSLYSKPKNIMVKNTATSYRQQVVDLALYYNSQETEYVHDESTGKDEDGNGKIGFDCSGFVSCVLNQVMQKDVKCYRLTANLKQLHDTSIVYNNGYATEFRAKTLCKGTIDWSKILPGDILFFNSPGGPKHDYPFNHCAIYLGDKTMIHSTGSADGVVVRPVDGNYITHFESAKRYVPSKKASPLNISMTATRDVKLYPAIQCYSGTHKYIVKKGKTLTIKSTTKFGTHYNAYATTSDGKYGYIYEYKDGKLA